MIIIITESSDREREREMRLLDSEGKYMFGGKERREKGGGKKGKGKERKKGWLAD